MREGIQAPKDQACELVLRGVFRVCARPAIRTSATSCSPPSTPLAWRWTRTLPFVRRGLPAGTREMERNLRDKQRERRTLSSERMRPGAAPSHATLESLARQRNFLAQLRILDDLTVTATGPGARRHRDSREGNKFRNIREQRHPSPMGVSSSDVRAKAGAHDHSSRTGHLRRTGPAEDQFGEPVRLFETRRCRGARRRQDIVSTSEPLALVQRGMNGQARIIGFQGFLPRPRSNEQEDRQVAHSDNFRPTSGNRRDAKIPLTKRRGFFW